MKVKRFKDATTYEAANHRGYTSFALINKPEGIKNFNRRSLALLARWRRRPRCRGLSRRPTRSSPAS